MKTQSLRRNSGFTLIELLIVITIIVVLAGAGFAAGNAAIQKAKRTTALAAATAIESAVSNFYTEYGSMPTAQALDLPAVNTGTDHEFLNALLGYTEKATTPLNARSIRFLTVKEGKAKGQNGGINGLITTGSGTTTSANGMFDPWSGPYYVLLDADYDEELKVKTAAATAETTLRGRRVAVWSNGADCISGVGGKVIDDVKTW